MKKSESKGTLGEEDYEEEVDDFMALQKTFRDGSGWIKQNYDLWEGLYGSNPIVRGFEHDNVQLTIQSCRLLMQHVLDNPMNQNHYLIFINLLPEVLQEEKHEIPEYGEFFSYVYNEEEKPSFKNFTRHIAGNQLPKFSDR